MKFLKLMLIAVVCIGNSTAITWDDRNFFSGNQRKIDEKSLVLRNNANKIAYNNPCSRKKVAFNNEKLAISTIDSWKSDDKSLNDKLIKSKRRRVVLNYEKDPIFAVKYMCVMAYDNFDSLEKRIELFKGLDSFIKDFEENATRINKIMNLLEILIKKDKYIAREAAKCDNVLESIINKSCNIVSKMSDQFADVFIKSKSYNVSKFNIDRMSFSLIKMFSSLASYLSDYTSFRGSSQIIRTLYSNMNRIYTIDNMFFDYHCDNISGMRANLFKFTSKAVNNLPVMDACKIKEMKNLLKNAPVSFHF